MNQNPYQTPREMEPAVASIARQKLLSMKLEEWLCVIVVIGVLMALLESAIDAHLAAKRRSQCMPSLNMQQMQEWLARQERTPKRDVDSLAKRWGIRQAAIAPILTACFGMTAFAVFVFAAAIGELWTPTSPEPPAATPESPSARAAGWRPGRR